MTERNKQPPRSNRKGSMGGEGSGSEGHLRPNNTRPTKANELSLAEHLAVLDEATELPPFGFNIAGLEQRLERRLGFAITQATIKGCLSPYYNLREWGERYVVTSLGTDNEDFPGEGNGNHPPRSPLKEFYLSEGSDSEDAAGGGGAEGVGGGGARSGGGAGGGAVASSRPRHGASSSGILNHPRMFSDAGESDGNGSSDGGDIVDIDGMELD